jgi:gluconokinase
VSYPELEAEALKGRTDGDMLQWARTHGSKLTDEEIEIWNDYLSKRAWRDHYTPRLHLHLQNAGLPTGSALTMFDFIDLDEGRAGAPSFQPFQGARNAR